MLTCKEVSELVSRSMEQRLPLGTRLAMRLHMLMCRSCAAYEHQVKALKKRNTYRKANMILRAETRGPEETRESSGPKEPTQEMKLD